MSTLLSIAILTKNRPSLLDAQLLWLSTELKGHESDCRVFILDDGSAVESSHIIKRWNQAFAEQGVSFGIHPCDEIADEPTNLILSVRHATDSFIWPLDEDNTMDAGAVSALLLLLRQRSALSLVMLNGTGRDRQSMKITTACFFPATTLKTVTGASEFEHFLEHAMAGVLSVTGAVYNREVLLPALTMWPQRHNDRPIQAYWAAFCAARGNFMITPPAANVVSSDTPEPVRKA